nr:MAG TPA: hypothetical protein [Caudoviricetes sp.]
MIGDGGYFCLRIFPRPNSDHKYRNMHYYGYL